MKRIITKKSIVLYIDKNEFCEWYFDNDDMNKDVVNELIEKGVVYLEYYLEGIGYLPVNMIKNSQDIKSEDFDDDELTKLDNYTIKFA